VYRQALGTADVVYATLIDIEVEGDTAFPELGSEWKETYREDHEADEKNAFPYSFITYTKIES